MSNVTDLLTRQPYEPEPAPQTDAERVASFVTVCADSIFFNAFKIRETAGIDLALRALHQAAEDIKAYGRK